MKKKVLFIITLCFSVMLLFSLLSVGVSATVGRNHNGKCPNGYKPLVSPANGSRVILYMCENCEQLASANKSYVAIGIQNGATFPDDKEYTIPLTDVGNLMFVMEKAGNKIIRVYQGCGDTNYPMSEEKPTQVGNYKVFLTTENLFSYYKETGNRAYLHIRIDGRNTFYIPVFSSGTEFSIVHEATYYSDGDALHAKCKNCGALYDETLTFGVQGTVGLCTFAEDELPVVDNGWCALTGEEYVRLYEGCEGTEYALSDVPPTEYGKYEVSLAPKSAWQKGTDQVKNYSTRPITLTLGEDLHKWEYHSEDKSLVAECKYCDTPEARVTLDSSAVYEACRQMNTGVLKQEMFYEENWSNHKTIAHYCLLYDGKELNGNGTYQYYSSIYQPEKAGSYSVRLVILERENDVTPESVKVSSKSMPFYIAGKMIKECNVVDYGPTEIAQFEKPRQDGNDYYVGTNSELQWCVYNQQDEMNIIITNDIVVNPILVSDEGNVTSGAHYIYKWVGFGYDEPFNGTIIGQGHTIYGLYVPSTNRYMISGFVQCGENAFIRDLNIENSYMKNSWAVGAFFGTLDISGSGFAGLESCYSLHNTLISDRRAGGLIGYIGNDTSQNNEGFLSIQGCTNDSTVNAPCAGGIIAETTSGEDSLCNGSMSQCYNYGTITGTNYAGGIIGKIFVWKTSEFIIKGCLNAGSIKANTTEGGIIAYLSDVDSQRDGFTSRVEISDTVNTGRLDRNAQTAADILASTGYCSTGFLTLGNNYYSQTKIAYPSNLTNAPTATKLTTKDIGSGKVCQILGHVAGFHFSDVVVAGCETTGSKTIRCTTCNTLLRTVTTGAHGHYFKDGNCVYCQKEGGLVASIFSGSSVSIAVIVILLLVSIGEAVIIIRNKKKA